MTKVVSSRFPNLEYSSKDERKCSILLERFIYNWKPKLGITYQRPITKKHDADFYLPEQNIILEYHPPVLKWYGANGVYKRLNRLRPELRQKHFIEVQDLLCEQISHDYYKTRRSLMDMSSLQGVSKMRLIVVKDFEEFYKFAIKPYSEKNIKYDKFVSALKSIG